MAVCWPFNYEKLRYNEERPYTVLIDSELSVVSGAIKVCLVQLIAMYPPDLPSRLYASGSAKNPKKKRLLENAVAGTDTIQSFS